MLKAATQALFCAAAVSAAVTSNDDVSLWSNGCLVGTSDTRKVNIPADGPTVESDSRLAPSYGTIKGFAVSESGRTLKVTLDGAEQDANTITGGPLGDATYKLDHFYTNFGTAFKGSDHTIDGEAELGEIHFVHFASGYADLKDAIKSGKTDAISVVSVMLVEGEDESPAYQVLSKAASGEAVELNVSELLPESLETALSTRYYNADALPELRRSASNAPITHYKSGAQDYFFYTAALAGTEAFCTRTMHIVMNADSAANAVTVVA